MPLNEPSWWYRESEAWQAKLLAPLGWLWGHATARRLGGGTPYRAQCPVICIGNFTAGGTGKTPMSLAVAVIVRDLGGTPVFLSRGYGGTRAGPIFVDNTRHTATEVGDEPLLLAQTAPAVIARDRAAGARLIERTAAPGTVIIMDDGLQNPYLVKDLVIAVVDGQRGLGNLAVIPAGPLRAPLAFQARLVDAIVVNGGSQQADFPGMPELLRSFSGPLLAARTDVAADAPSLRGVKVVAFAGIANPERFFRSLESQRAMVCDRIAFGDHHAFTAADCERLLATATAQGARLITTEKDFARLKGRSEPALQRLRASSQTLAMELVLEDSDLAVLRDLIAKAVAPATVAQRT